MKVGLSRTTARMEKPRASRVCLSARSQTHTGTLNALARECVGRLGCFHTSGGHHDQVAVDLAGDLDDLGTLVQSDPIDADVDRGTGPNRCGETGGPSGETTR